MTPLAWARSQVGLALAAGNLDPCILMTDRPIIQREVTRVGQEGGGRGHIFNLGHGIMQHTPVDHVKYLVDVVRQASDACRV